MRLVVTGGRNFAGFALVDRAMADFEETWGHIDVLIHGGAPGADTLCAAWAHRHNKQVWEFPANWTDYGKSAGAIRNEMMILQGKPDRGLVFPGGRGTAHMHGVLIKYRVPVEVVG